MSVCYLRAELKLLARCLAELLSDVTRGKGEKNMAFPAVQLNSHP